VVPITVKIMVMIDAVVLIILMFQYLVHLVGKSLFTLHKLVFGLFDPLNGLRYQQKSKKAHPRVSHQVENLTSGLHCRYVI